MIYVTGDTHIPHDAKKLGIEQFPAQEKMTKDDLLIVLGDCGLIWHEDNTYKYWLKKITNFNYTFCFLDGNHDNIPWIRQFPEQIWNGGTIHRIAPNIIHLERSQIYEIQGHKIFTLGGASSIDKDIRTPQLDWWPEENITEEEKERAKEKLKKVHYNVDFILTHTCPESIYKTIFKPTTVYPDPTANFLDEIASRAIYHDWYFGHHHKDINYGKFHGLYNTFQKIS